MNSTKKRKRKKSNPEEGCPKRYDYKNKDEVLIPNVKNNISSVFALHYLLRYTWQNADFIREQYAWPQ